MEGNKELRTTLWFGKTDEDLLLALNKMCLEDNRSKNNIVKCALKSHLVRHGYLDEKGNYDSKA